MLRGVVTLPLVSISVAISFLPANPTNSFLLAKLQSASTQTTTETTIQLSEDEAELILDNLPPPHANDDPALKQLRLNLQNFLSQLRTA